MAKIFSKKFYNSKKWQEIRQIVLQRDFHICQLCGEANANIVHHKIELTIFNIDNTDITLNANNLITLCSICHDEVHSRNTRTQEPRCTFDSDGRVVQRACKAERKASKYSDCKRYTQEWFTKLHKLQCELNNK